MRIEKPIFIIGSGRSGTTILYELLSMHPEVCWFANYNELVPVLRTFPLFHRAFDLPGIGNYLKKCIIKTNGSRFRIRPIEGDDIYQNYCGFEENRKTTEQDLTDAQEAKFRAIIEKYIRITGKKRFLSKQISNNQRLRVMNAMFPDAYYVHILRDGRAVTSSLSRVDWWKDIIIWWYGHGADEWEREGRDPIELCCLHWMRDVREILENSPLFGERYMEIRYEELTGDVHATIRKILAFSGLSQSRSFFDLLPETLPNMDHKWEKNLTEEQKRVVNNTLGAFMAELAARKAE